MKVFILLLTLVSQNLAEGNSSLGADNSVLGMQFRTKIAESSIKNFVILSASEESKNNSSLRADSQDLRGNPPIKKMQKSQGGLPRSHSLARNDNLLDSSLRLRSARNDKIGAENDRNSARIAESNKNSTDSAPFSQGGLPRSRTLARNDNFIRDSSPTAQNDNLWADSANSTKTAESTNKTQQTIEGIAVEVAEFLGDFECKTGLESAQCSKSPKSPQDAPKSKLKTLDKLATCKDDITGFWLSPLDKVSARTSIIEIFKKDGKYFAYNVAFLDELPPKKDALNQNFALRDREILGSVYAYNLERSGEVSYINGRYYDFNKGKIFHLKAKLDCNELILLISADNVGFLGKKKIYKAIQKSEAEFYIKTRPTIDFSGVK